MSPVMSSDLASPQPPSKVRSLLALAGFGGVTAAAAAVGTVATLRGKGLWYRMLRKPPFNPPDWLFGPVWTALYGMIALSGWRVYLQPPSDERSEALSLWAAQLGLNSSWSVLFFGRHETGVALGELAGLVATIGAYMAAARKVDRKAALLMAPYLAWSSFALLLNEEIVRRN